MKDIWIDTGSGSRLHALQWEGGPDLAIAFHGYSNNASLWQPLAPLIRSTHTLISVDLPFHGQSRWNAGGILSRAGFTSGMLDLLAGYATSRADLLGFSLGGRVSLCLAEDAGDSIRRVVLAAPDGLQPNPFYRFVTGTTLGKRLFSGFVNRPEGYIRLLDLLHRRKWIDSSRYRFMMHHIGSAPARQFLGGAWPSLREMVPDLRRLRGSLSAHDIPIDLFMGRFDTVIPLAHGERFAATCAPGVTLHTLERGHHILDQGVFHQMARILQQR